MSLRKIIKNKVGFNKNNIEDEEDSDETKLKTKLEEVELQNFSFVPSKVKNHGREEARKGVYKGEISHRGTQEGCK